MLGARRWRNPGWANRKGRRLLRHLTAPPHPPGAPEAHLANPTQNRPPLGTPTRLHPPHLLRPFYPFLCHIPNLERSLRSPNPASLPTEAAALEGTSSGEVGTSPGNSSRARQSVCLSRKPWLPWNPNPLSRRSAAAAVGFGPGAVSLAVPVLISQSSLLWGNTTGSSKPEVPFTRGEPLCFPNEETKGGAQKGKRPAPVTKQPNGSSRPKAQVLPPGPLLL